ARSESLPEPDAIRKLSLFSGVPAEAISLLPNAETIYEVPLTLEQQGIDDVIVNRLGLKAGKPSLREWQYVVERAKNDHSRTYRIGIVAKYMDNQDTYMSVFEALKAAAWHEKGKAELVWIDAEKLHTEADVKQAVTGLDGIVVPGGFGVRGLEGKILAARYALREKLPYLGLCLGLQMAVI